MKKFALICLGIFISLIITETTLQIASIILQNKVNSDIKNKIVKKEHIKILCIGESTTSMQYPVYLQELLDKDYPNKFSVIDCGLPGKQSIEILEQIENWINRFEPDIIISMLGINDWKILPWDKWNYGLFYKLFNKFRLYKMIYYFMDNIKTIKANKSMTEKNNLSNYLQLIKETNLDSENKIKTDILFDKLIKDFYKKNNKYENYYMFSNMKNIDHCVIYEYLIKNNIKNDDKFNYNYEIFSYANKKDIENIPQEQYNDILYGGKAIEFIKNKDINNAKIFFEKAEEYRLKHFNFNTFKTYNEIVDTASVNNIKFMAMQYPVRSINSLKKLLYANKNYKNITFISNEENFKKYLYNITSYDDLFTDQFAGDFGHCTKSGNIMIAENAKKYIVDYCKDILQ